MSGRAQPGGMTSAPSRVRVVIAARAAIRRDLHDTLAGAGLDVASECGSVGELLAAVSRERPDVCVLDRELRGGGLTAIAALASPRPAPKILVVGGRGTPAEVRAARLAGAAACVPADVDPAALAAAVSRLISTEEER